MAECWIICILPGHLMCLLAWLHCMLDWLACLLMGCLTGTNPCYLLTSACLKIMYCPCLSPFWSLAHWLISCLLACRLACRLICLCPRLALSCLGSCVHGSCPPISFHRICLNFPNAGHGRPLQTRLVMTLNTL